MYAFEIEYNEGESLVFGSFHTLEECSANFSKIWDDVPDHNDVTDITIIQKSFILALDKP